jgi:hypothetical protein
MGCGALGQRNFVWLAETRCRHLVERKKSKRVNAADKQHQTPREVLNNQNKPSNNIQV